MSLNCDKTEGIATSRKIKKYIVLHFATSLHKNNAILGKCDCGRNNGFDY